MSDKSQTYAAPSRSSNTLVYDPKIHGQNVHQNLEAGAYQLLIDVGGHQEQRYLSLNSQVVVGFDENASLKLPQVPGLSRKHAIFEYSADGLTIAHLCSPVTINGQPLGHRRGVETLDVIGLGSVTITIGPRIEAPAVRKNWLPWTR